MIWKWRKIYQIRIYVRYWRNNNLQNSGTLRSVVKNIDLKYLLLETDSPYLAPTPYRGKVNEPKNVKLVAEKIAEIKNIDIDEVYKITTNNAICQFDLKDKL